MSATHQLAAILFADIHAYTELIQDNEAKAMIISDYPFQKPLQNNLHFRKMIQ